MLKGCLVIVVLIVMIHVASCVFTIGNIESAKRDERLEAEAKKAEIQKKQMAEAERIAEVKKMQEEKAAEAERKRQMKADKVRTFALKDAPKVWDVYQALASEIDVQDGKIDELRKTLVAFGRSPEKDEDFNRICVQRDEMIRSQKALYVKLEDAYIAACKFAATPSRKDYNDLQKKAIEDGIKEAELAAAKFKELRLSK